jgi:hypothetical protein
VARVGWRSATSIIVRVLVLRGGVSKVATTECRSTLWRGLQSAILLGWQLLGLGGGQRQFCLGATGGGNSAAPPYIRGASASTERLGRCYMHGVVL